MIKHIITYIAYNLISYHATTLTKCFVLKDEKFASTGYYNVFVPTLSNKFVFYTSRVLVSASSGFISFAPPDETVCRESFVYLMLLFPLIFVFIIIGTCLNKNYVLILLYIAIVIVRIYFGEFFLDKIADVTDTSNWSVYSDAKNVSINT